MEKGSTNTFSCDVVVAKYNMRKYKNESTTSFLIEIKFEARGVGRGVGIEVGRVGGRVRRRAWSGGERR